MGKMKKLLKVNRAGLDLVRKVMMHKKYPEVSDYQADMMLHALGADSKPYRSYNDNKTYKAYRNHYDAGGDDIADWDDLVEKGLATKNRMYHVSPKGIYLLECLTQCTIYDDYETVADAKDVVLEAVIKHDVFCGYGCWLPISAVDISRSYAIPVLLVRATLNKLAEDGYVKKGYEGGLDEDGCPHCKHGWFCTQKTRQLDIHKELQSAEYKRMDDIFRAEGASS